MNSLHSESCCKYTTKENSLFEGGSAAHGSCRQVSNESFCIVWDIGSWKVKKFMTFFCDKFAHFPISNGWDFALQHISMWFLPDLEGKQS